MIANIWEQPLQVCTPLSLNECWVILPTNNPKQNICSIAKFSKVFWLIYCLVPFIIPACPSAPKDFKVAEVSRHHVHLMWEAPEHDGGSPVTHYQIEKREVSRKTWAKVHVTVPLCSAVR